MTTLSYSACWIPQKTSNFCQESHFFWNLLTSVIMLAHHGRRYQELASQLLMDQSQQSRGWSATSNQFKWLHSSTHVDTTKQRTGRDRMYDDPQTQLKAIWCTDIASVSYERKVQCKDVGTNVPEGPETATAPLQCGIKSELGNKHSQWTVVSFCGQSITWHLAGKRTSASGIFWCRRKGTRWRGRPDQRLPGLFYC